MIACQMEVYQRTMQQPLHDHASADREQSVDDRIDPISNDGKSDGVMYQKVVISRRNTVSLCDSRSVSTTSSSSTSSSCTSTTRGRRRFRKSKPVQQTMNQRLYSRQVILIDISEVLIHTSVSQEFPTDDGSVSSISLFSLDYGR
jgi:hypothetical protein